MISFLLIIAKSLLNSLEDNCEKSRHSIVFLTVFSPNRFQNTKLWEMIWDVSDGASTNKSLVRIIDEGMINKRGWAEAVGL